MSLWVECLLFFLAHHNLMLRKCHDRRRVGITTLPSSPPFLCFGSVGGFSDLQNSNEGTVSRAGTDKMSHWDGVGFGRTAWCPHVRYVGKAKWLVAILNRQRGRPRREAREARERSRHFGV
ncbi:hypothetical protein HDK77DRAFT_154410 [Phyllosticta capitalensis]